MKVIRCKDCVLSNSLDCPLNYIDKQTIKITNRSQMFFCAKGQASKQYEPTYGDEIRNKTDAELAEYLYRVDRDGYDMKGNEGKNFSWENIKKHWRKFVSTAISEDI